MPLDTSIPMQIAQVPQTQALNPMALYQMMQERQAGALRNQLVQQEMLKNNLAMQYAAEDRRAAAAKAARDLREQQEMLRVLQGGRIPARDVVMGPGTIQASTPAGYDFEGVKNKMLERGSLSGYEALSKAQQQEAARKEAEAKAIGQGLTNVKTQAETKGLDLKNLTDEFKNTQTLLGSAGSPDAVIAIFNKQGDLIRRMGGDPEKSAQDFMAMLSNPAYGETPQDRFNNAVTHVSQSVAAMQKHVSDMMTAQKPEIKNISGVGMVAVNPYAATGKRVTIDGKPLMPTASEIPELKKGEQWNAEKQRVEAVPGSDIYIQQSQKHGKDVNAVKTVQSATDAALANIDKILAPENEDAFNSNFGGYNAYATRMQSGPTQTIGAAIDSLRSTMKATGAQLMRSQGGAVGSITEREWPILEGMVASLNPLMPEKDAREIIANVRQRLANLNDISKETYDTTWGNTQYYKPNAGGNKTSGATDNKSIFDAADAILGGK